MGTAEPEIRLLTPDDLDEAFGLSAAAGWNQRMADWTMLMRLAPAGSFAAVTGGRIVGTAIGIDYGAFGWIAMMLVDPALRGRGLGARLLEAAIAAVPGNVPIRLDATPLGRPLYRRFGFADEAVLTRYVSEASARPGGLTDDRATRGIRAVTTADLAAVTARDVRVFGAHRRILLEWAFDAAPRFAHLIESGGDAHYGFGRSGRLFDQIGPVVAADDQTAQALVSAALLAADGRAVAIDAFDRHANFTEWLLSRGFTASRPLFRMRRASLSGSARGEAPRVIDERAILGPEFG
jgi:GNAT superfamily N-acetyltransferase